MEHIIRLEKLVEFANSGDDSDEVLTGRIMSSIFRNLGVKNVITVFQSRISDNTAASPQRRPVSLSGGLHSLPFFLSLEEM
jgi:hypothetical protein